jgi:hypothetical protein
MSNNYVELDRKVVTSAVSSITFTGISQNYQDLVIMCHSRYTSSNAGQGIGIRFNNDSGTNYSTTILEGDGSADSSYRGSNQNAASCGAVSNGTQTHFATTLIEINNYSNVDTYKNFLYRSAGPTYVQVGVGYWRPTGSSNITDVTILSQGTAGNLDVGCTFSLYGISNVYDSTTKAVGGVVTSDATHFYHAFPMSARFTPLQSLTADILIVAGGGGGGGNVGGGGGAGGLVYYSSQSLTATPYTVTVGGGGAGGIGNSGIGSNGGNSTFTGGVLSLVTAVGGGYGGNLQVGYKNGANGGSGGGGATSFDTGTSATGGSATQGAPGLGNAGGTTPTGVNGDARAASGGGGAGAAGSPGATIGVYIGGAGGAGVNTYSTFSSVTGTGVSGFYAGGGGGSVQQNTGGTPGVGGAGGGGNGAGQGSWASPAAPASGGGGGGGGNGNFTYGNFGAIGGQGGSGVVIVRYAK